MRLNGNATKYTQGIEFNRQYFTWILNLAITRFQDPDILYPSEL